MDQPKPSSIENQELVPVPAKPILPAKRRTSFIARLPKATRDQINIMILDGVPYLDILSRIGPEVRHITEDHLSDWRTRGGFQDWLIEQQKLDLLRGRRDFAFDMVEKKGGSQIPQTVLQLLATNICEFIVDLNPANLRDSLLSDSDKFSRFVGTMVKLAEGEIKCEQHQNAQEDRAAAAAKRKSPAEKPGISTESLLAAEAKLRLL